MDAHGLAIKDFGPPDLMEGGPAHGREVGVS